MSDFDQKLKRLKEALSVNEDQEVAAVLGMTKASFSDRKRRQAFPAERVIGLQAQRPDLDVSYVLTGDKLSKDDGFFRFMASESSARSRALPDSFVEGYLESAKLHFEIVKVAWAHPALRSLLDAALYCDQESLNVATQLVALLASRSRGKTEVLNDLRSALSVRDSAESKAIAVTSARQPQDATSPAKAPRRPQTRQMPKVDEGATSGSPATSGEAPIRRKRARR